MDSLLGTLQVFPSLLAAGDGHGVSVEAEPLIESVEWLTNSIFVAVVVLFVIIIFARKATKRVSLIPSGIQNGVEFIFEFLYDQVEQIVGKKVAPRAFPLLGTIFVFILISNLCGLLPGVGTIGFGNEADKVGFLGLKHLAVPLLRPATADLNLTLAIALISMVVWFWITMRETGLLKFVKHMFEPKGGLTGFIGIVLIPIFLFVGVIEIISIAFRPVSLSMRLFGNIYAGENLLHAMGAMGENWGAFGSFVSSIVLPLPFYFMEILVGLMQAMVFALLVAVYIQLSTTHEEEDHG